MKQVKSQIISIAVQNKNNESDTFTRSILKNLSNPLLIDDGEKFSKIPRPNPKTYTNFK